MKLKILLFSCIALALILGANAISNLTRSNRTSALTTIPPLPNFVITRINISDELDIQHKQNILVTVKNIGGGISGYYANNQVLRPLNITLGDGSMACTSTPICYPRSGTAIQENYFPSGYTKTIPIELDKNVFKKAISINIKAMVDLPNYYAESKEMDNVKSIVLKIPRIKLPDFFIKAITRNKDAKNRQILSMLVVNKGGGTSGYDSNNQALLPLKITVGNGNNICTSTPVCYPRSETAIQAEYFPFNYSSKWIEMEVDKNIFGTSTNSKVKAMIDLPNYFAESDEKNNVTTKTFK
jgi:hypothetical protein